MKLKWRVKFTPKKIKANFTLVKVILYLEIRLR